MSIENTETLKPSPGEDTASPVDDRQFELGFTAEPTPIQVPAPAVAIPAPAYAQLTEDDYKRFVANAETVDKIASSLEQRFGTAFGKIGGIEQRMKEWQASTPHGQAVTASVEDFEEMQSEFPELTEMHLKGLNRALSKMKGTGSSFDVSKVEEIVNARVEKARQEDARATLTDAHQDWETVVGAKDAVTPYRQWLKTQPPTYQTQLAETWRPGVIAQSITRFKAERKLAAPARTVAPPHEAARRQRLAEAVAPRGAGGHPPSASADDEMERGFNS